MVKIGLGFHVEFTLPEALEFIVQKEKHLTKYLEPTAAAAHARSYVVQQASR